MYNAVFMITFAAGATDAMKADFKTAATEAANALTGVNIMGDVLPYAFGGGDYFLELGFPLKSDYEAAKEQAAWSTLHEKLGDSALIDHYEFVAYGEGKLTITSDKAKCHRVLIYAIVPDAKPEMLEKMERIMPDMPNYIPGLLNCKLARVEECSGTMKWAYAFECDFDDPMTFLSSYNFRPYHWSFIDKFFEPSCEEWVADPNLCTPYIAAESAFLLNYIHA